MQKELLSFHGKQEIKDIYVARVKAHAAADEIAQGYYWQNGKGCAVGCTIHGDEHYRYETELGIPRIIARLEDRIFEGLPNAEAKTFPLEFIEAIPVGVNLDSVWRKFLVWLLTDEVEGVIKFSKSEKTRQAIQDVSDLIQRSLTEKIKPAQFLKVRQAAYAYAYADAAAADAAAYAATAAAAADAADAAAADAYAAAAYAAAAYAADAYADAADAAAAYADAADAYAADACARYKKFGIMRRQLIHLLATAA